ncbi:MAG: glycosyl transferase [SAR116 cluster bacterium]|nr:glycosyl transferase [SAR116 cluster bacterium]RPG97180.1 MAG: glycosyltransferase family 2 protein [Candidatus Puniceispirillum sp. TMED176]
MTRTKAAFIPPSTIEISVLVPVMNEAGNIRPLIEEISAVLTGRRFEIIYVDDASTDDSPAELASCAADIPELRVLRHQTRAGQSAAIRSALLAARGELIGVLDGDGQNVPADLPALEAALLAETGKTGATGMAAGIRARRQDSAMRLLASRGARWIRRSLLADTHPDSGCGIKVLHRSLFLQLPFFNHMHRFMPSLVRRHGGVVIGVAVAHRPRLRGTSKYRILDRLVVGISDVIGVIWLLRRAPRQGEVTEVMAGKKTAQKAVRKVAKKTAKKASKKASNKASNKGVGA